MTTTRVRDHGTLLTNVNGAGTGTGASATGERAEVEADVSHRGNYSHNNATPRHAIVLKVGSLYLNYLLRVRVRQMHKAQQAGATIT